MTLRAASFLAVIWAVLSLSAPLPAAGAAATWLDQPMTSADRRHLLARTGFGVAPDDWLALDGLTRREGVERIIAGLRVEPSVPMPDYTRRPAPPYYARGSFLPDDRRRFGRARDAELAALRRWWTAEMLVGDSPQTERLVLLWHDLVPTHYEVTDRASLAMARQNALFRASHSGRWADLLKALLRDAALLDYLDADRNRRGAPNENLGREFLELFTLGQGSYGESDVRAAARALTGLGVADTHDLAFRLRTWHQDRDDKTLFGRTGAYDADALVDAVLAQPAAARHLASVYRRAFIDDRLPDGDSLEALATRFRAADHDLAVLYRAILESEAFWADEHRAAIVRTPVDLVTGVARTLEYPKRHAQSVPGWQGQIGLSLFAPPNVAGWPDGDAWVAPGRLLGRYAVVASLLEAADAAPRDESQPMTMAGDAMADDTMAGDTGARLRIASEAYEGPAEIVASLRLGDRTLWQSGVMTLHGGHDTERYGRVASEVELPWQELMLDAPASAVEQADALRVLFVNDAAGVLGDRNVYVSGARSAARTLSASDGEQVSHCVPEAAVDAGNLYCSGYVTLPVPASTAPPTHAVRRAAGVHLRWANVNEAGRTAVSLVLERPTLSGASRDHVQFEIVTEPGGVPELRIDNSDCLPDCLQRWPDCAWQDPHAPGTRSIAVPLAAQTRARDDCMLALDAADRTLLDDIARAAPALLDRIVDIAPPVLAQHRDAVQTIRHQLREHLATVEPLTIVLDARLRPEPVDESPSPPVVPRVESLQQLVDALAPTGLDAVELLWPGVPLEPAIAAIESPEQRLAAVLEHPAFQLK